MIERKLTEEQQRNLCAPITEEEVKMAAFSIGNNKAPGPDGNTAGFFKRHWSCVEHDLIAAVLEFFTHGKMPKAWNGTATALVPKVPVPNAMKYFRQLLVVMLFINVYRRLLSIG